MTQDDRFGTAGLVFTQVRAFDIVRLANHAGAGLAALGQRVEGTRILSDGCALIIAADHEIRLALDEEVPLAALPAPAACVLSVTVTARAGHPASAFARDAVAGQVLRTLYEALRPDHVKWIDTDVLLTSGDFADATGVTPARADGAPARARHNGRATALPDIEETNAILQQRLTDHDPAIFDALKVPERTRRAFFDTPSDGAFSAASGAGAEISDADIEHAVPRRLSAWMMALAVAALALPVGVALLLLNLLKGENLRLASQTAALTGTFIGLQAYPATARTIGLLQGMFG
jgi:hypothetical protein